MRDHALLHGRFQPPSIGHAAMVAVTLQEWDRITIGVVHDSERPNAIDPRFVDYANIVDAESYGIARMPFSADEVSAMWQAYLEHERIAERARCISCKRIEYDPSFNSDHPADRYDLVWPDLTSEDAATDRMRDALFQEVLRRPIFHVRPTLKLHNSLIRRLIASGRSTWDQFIPPGAYEVFREIDGHRRMDVAIRERAMA